MQKPTARNIALFHPGEILLDEFLLPLKISSERLANDTSINIEEINELIKGNRNITEEIATRLADFFGTTPQFWLCLQNNYDSASIR